jgi:hypothetical protein
MNKKVQGMREAERSPERLGELLQRWAAYSALADRRKAMRQDLASGVWMQACQQSAQQGRLDEIKQWLESLEDPGQKRAEPLDTLLKLIRDLGTAGEFYSRQMQAYLHTAQAALQADVSGQDACLLRAHELTRLPLGFYQNLGRTFRVSPADRPETRTERISVLLVQSGGTGVVGTLVLEQLVRGTGALFPAASMGFVLRDPAFQEAERQALRYVKRTLPAACVCDVQWHLETQDTLFELTGGSLGGSFALGLTSLYRSPSDLTAYALVAGIAENGALVRVDDQGLHAKLRAAHSTERAFDLVMSVEQGIPKPIAYRFEYAVVDSVESAYQRIAQRRQRAKRRRLLQRSGAALVSGMALWLLLFTAGLFVSSLQIRPGGRLMVVAGIDLPGLRHGELDTGILEDEVQSDRLSTVMGHGYFWSQGASNTWFDRIVPYLKNPSRKAQLLAAVGRKAEAVELLQNTLQTGRTEWQIEACTTLSSLAPEQHASVGAAALRLYSKWGDYHEKFPDLVTLLMAHCPERKQEWLRDTRAYIDHNPQNDVRIPAARPIIRYDLKTWGGYPAGGSFLQHDFPINSSLGKHCSDFHMWLEYLAMHDQAGYIATDAGYELYVLDPSTYPIAMEVCRRHITYTSDPRQVRNVFRILQAIAYRDPEHVFVTPPVYDGIERKIALGTSNNLLDNAVSGYVLSRVRALLGAATERELLSAIAQMPDIPVKSKEWEQALACVVALRLTEVYRKSAVWEERSDSGKAVRHFLQLMDSPLSDRWSILRHACAFSMYFCVRPADREKIYTLLQQAWSVETKAHVRVALSLALNEFHFVP